MDLEFERAAGFRDQLKYTEQTVGKQKIISNDHTQRDILNFYVDKSRISVQVFFLRRVRLLRQETRLFPLTNTNEPQDAFVSFIAQFYGQGDRVLPKEALVPVGIDNETLAEVLGVAVETPQRDQKRALLEMAHDSAKLKLDEEFRLSGLGNRKTRGTQKKIFDALGLPYGHRIKSFSHSHIQGVDPVSALIVFTDGEPGKYRYRKYKLKGEVEHRNAADGVRNTHEVVRRRYSRLLKEHKKMSDLILMDGGQIQINACLDVLRNELNVNIPVAGIVKDDHHRTNHLIFGDPTRGEELKLAPLNPKSKGFYLMTKIQDEVHRFVITLRRRTHAKSTLSSELDEIKGIGSKSRNKLLQKLGFLKKIKEALIEKLRDAGLTLP